LNHPPYKSADKDK